MKVSLTKQEAEELFKLTGNLKYKILLEMVEWSSDPEYLKELVLKAEKEYNELRSFAGKKYPYGRCKNIVELLSVCKKLWC